MTSRHPVDFAERLSAVTTFDGNVVVIAGAGTGKTALLIAKITLFLLGESYRLDPLKTPSKRVEEVLALTFTDKAAAEMGERLLSFLRELSEAEEADETDGAVHDLIAAPLLDVYGVSWTDIRWRARSMLEYVDRVETLTVKGDGVVRGTQGKQAAAILDIQLAARIKTEFGSRDQCQESIGFHVDVSAHFKRDTDIS